MDLKSEKGYSLVEVLFSMVLLSFASSSYMLCSASSGLSSIHSVRQSLAANMIQNVANELSMVPSSNVWVLTQSELPPGTQYPQRRYFTYDGTETNVIADSYFTIVWYVYGDTPIAGAKTIGMSIEWTEADTPRHLGMRVVR